MTREEQTKLLAEFYAEKKNVLKLKSEDYANEDVLSNFKSAGANIGISAELQCLSLIATKIARLGNLFSGKKPNNESVSDSILDLSNYTDLLYCLVNEQITDEVNNELKKQEKNKLLETKLNDLLDEKYRLYEVGTKRWENVEPIKEPYEPKVGDRFKNLFGEEYEIIEIVNNKFILKNKYGNRTYTLADMELYIKDGQLKKIN